MTSDRYPGEPEANYRARVRLGNVMVELFRSIDARTPEQVEVPTIDLPVLTSYMRACGLFQGVRALVSEGLGQEALLMGRPLFEEALRLHHLAQVDTGTRHGLVAYWYRELLTRDEGLFRDGPRGPEAAAPPLARIREMRADFDRYASHHKIKQQRMPDATFLVRTYADAEAAWVWTLSQQMVHGGSQSHSFRFDGDSGGNYSYRLGSSEPDGLRLPTMWACRSLGLGRDAMTAIFTWPEIAGLVDEALTAISAVR